MNDRDATAHTDATTLTEDVATSVMCIDGTTQREAEDKGDVEYEVVLHR
jgi:hypothetical protein